MVTTVTAPEPPSPADDAAAAEAERQRRGERFVSTWGDGSMIIMRPGETEPLVQGDDVAPWVPPPSTP